MRLIGLLVAAFLLLPPAVARGSEMTVTAPREPVPEELGFAVVVRGTTDTPAPPGTRVITKIRLAFGFPCAARPGDDAGRAVLDAPVSGDSFSVTGDHVAPDPGPYLVCAWLVGDSLEVLLGPTPSLVSVRPAHLRISIDGRHRVRAGSPVEVDIRYASEVPRALSVLLVPGRACHLSESAVGEAFVTVADLRVVAGSGYVSATAREVSWGTYVFCGYVENPDAQAGMSAELAAIGPTVRVGEPARRCGAIGGRRGITRIRTSGITCARGRAIARRWGSALRAPSRIAGFACSRRPGRRVRCIDGSVDLNFGEVSFRYRR